MPNASALFIGRFQPFHLGHLSVIKQALKEVDYLIIGIGSAENNFQPNNPFTAGERWQMIKTALDAEKIIPSRYCLIPIRNINNYSLWSKHVATLTPPFTIVYTGSPIVKELFSKEKIYQIKDIAKTINVCSTTIRNNILKNRPWQKFLHPETLKVIKQINGEERIRKIGG